MEEKSSVLPQIIAAIGGRKSIFLKLQQALLK